MDASIRVAAWGSIQTVGKWSSIYVPIPIQVSSFLNQRIEGSGLGHDVNQFLVKGLI